MDDYYSLLLDRPVPKGEPVEQKRELAARWWGPSTGRAPSAEAEKTSMPSSAGVSG